MEELDAEIRHECNACREQHNSLKEAYDCYRSHTPEEAVTRIVEGEDTRNLVALLERYSDVATDDELRRVRAWVMGELRDD